MTWSYLYRYLKINKMTYVQYLQSEHWKQLKDKFYHSKMGKHKCYACGKAEKLNLHHKTYRRIGHERLNDLVLLCENCHKKAHKYADAFKNSSKAGKALYKSAKKVRRCKA